MKSVIISLLAFVAALAAHTANAEVVYSSEVGGIYYVEKDTIGLGQYTFVGVAPTAVNDNGGNLTFVGDLSKGGKLDVTIGYNDAFQAGNAKLKQSFNIGVSSSWRLTDTSKKTRVADTGWYIGVNAGAQWGGDAHVTFSQDGWRYDRDHVDVTGDVKAAASILGTTEKYQVDQHNEAELNTQALFEGTGYEYDADTISAYTQYHHQEYKTKTNFTAGITLKYKF